MGGSTGSPVIYFEVGGRDAAALKNFYSTLFRWDVRSSDPAGYGLVAPPDESGGVAGGIHGFPEGKGYLTVYVATDDVAGTMKRAEELGGRAPGEPREIEAMDMTVGHILDPDGTLIGLMHARRPLPTGGGKGAPVDYFDIETPDAPRLKRFLRELFGWEAGDGDYAEVHLHGGMSAGIEHAPGKEPHLRWYARVEDVSATMAQAESLGGEVCAKPFSPMEGLTVANAKDPEGNMFGVYRYTQP